MEHNEKIEWLAVWAAKNRLQLMLEGECGFGRPCVGVGAHDVYVDYHWYDPITYERVDKNGEVWTPRDAYHKHECTAVLGRGEEAESQLYDWVKWFDENGFVVEEGIKSGRTNSPLELLFTGLQYVRMVRK